MKRFLRKTTFALAGLGALSTLLTLSASCADADETVTSDGGVAALPEAGSEVRETGAEAGADADCGDGSTDGGCTARELTCDEADFCSVPSGVDSRYALLSVWGSAANDVWAVGSGGTIVHWDGAAWASVPFARKESLRAVGGSSANDVWIAGSAVLIGHTDGFRGASTTFEFEPPFDPNDTTNYQGTIFSFIRGIGTGDFLLGGPSTNVYPQHNLWRHRTVASGDTTTSPWEPVSTYCIVGQFCENANGVWGVSPDKLWVVSDKGVVRRALGPVGDGGGAEQWSVVKNTLTSADLYGVWGSSDADVWVVGAGGTIRHWAEGAKHWEAVDVPTNEDLRAIWGTAANDAWAVGDAGTILHWDGSAWTAATATLPVGPKPRFWGIWGSGPNDVWIVGEAIALHYTGPKTIKGAR